jgi:hypothetical protein
MKKDTSTSKLVSCNKRRSTGKLSLFEPATLLRSSKGSAAVLARKHIEPGDTRNATFKCRLSDEAFQRLYHQKSPVQQTDLPPSLPKRFGSVENAGTLHPVGTDCGAESQNARFDSVKHNPFWESTRRVDLPPSYNRPESVSTQLNKMCLSVDVPNRTKVERHSSYSKKPLLSLPLQRAIEVSPRVMAKVRGPQETWSCLKRDFYQACSCQNCKIELTCIQDLDFVLCPTCSQLTTLEARGGGVGLGFTFNDLRRWEVGVLQERPSFFSAFTS